MQPVVARPQGIGIARNAPNAKAAVAFVDFVLSPEGQQLLESMGRVPVSIHILAPSMRPVQVTHDLANFWREHYPRIKSELQRKYPKHEWR